MSAMMSDFDLRASAKSIVPVSQFVTFTCGDRSFGVDIMSVREIRSWSPTTALPSQPRGAKGVLDIRGSVVQIYDLDELLGGPGLARDGNAGRVVLVATLGTEDVGMLVDTVSDIIFARAEELLAVPRTGGGTGPGMVSALVKNEDRLIGILDLKALFPSTGPSGLPEA